MSEIRGASGPEALLALRTTGDQFALVPRALKPLGHFAYTDPEDSQRQGSVEADDRVLRAIGTLYAPTKQFRSALAGRDARVGTFSDGLKVIKDRFTKLNLIWGVVGRVTFGEDCRHEAAALQHLYDYLHHHRAVRPSMVVDGGSCWGAPAISAVMAQKAGIETFGIRPLEGFASMAPRSHVMAFGHTFTQSSSLIGALPDAIAVAGGGAHAVQAVMQALRLGVTVLMLPPRPRDTAGLTSRWMQYPAMAEANQRGQLLTCASMDVIRPQAELARERAVGNLWAKRHGRLTVIKQRLTPML